MDAYPPEVGAWYGQDNLGLGGAYKISWPLGQSTKIVCSFIPIDPLSPRSRFMIDIVIELRKNK